MNVFKVNQKLKSQNKAVYKDARLQKPKRRRYVVFSVQNAQYIKIYVLKTFKNSEIKSQEGKRRRKEKVS